MPRRHDAPVPTHRLTPRTHQRVIDAIRVGNHWEAAAARAHISRATLYSWYARGRDAYLALDADALDAIEYHEDSNMVESLPPLPEPAEAPFVRLYIDLHAAEAAAEVRLVSQWAAAAAQDWRAAERLLAKRFPGRWGDSPIEVHHTGDGIPAVEMPTERSLTDDDARTAAVLAILEEAGAIPPGVTEVATVVVDGTEDDAVHPGDADVEADGVPEPGES